MEIADNNTPIELYSSKVKEKISRVTQFLIINKKGKAKLNFNRLI